MGITVDNFAFNQEDIEYIKKYRKSIKYQEK